MLWLTSILHIYEQQESCSHRFILVCFLGYFAIAMQSTQAIDAPLYHFLLYYCHLTSEYSPPNISRAPITIVLRLIAPSEMLYTHAMDPCFCSFWTCVPADASIHLAHYFMQCCSLADRLGISARDPSALFLTQFPNANGIWAHTKV